MKTMKQSRGVERRHDQLVTAAVEQGGVMPSDVVDDIFRVTDGITKTLGGLAGAAMPVLGGLGI